MNISCIKHWLRWTAYISSISLFGVVIHIFIVELTSRFIIFEPNVLIRSIELIFLIYTLFYFIIMLLLEIKQFCKEQYNVV